MHEIEPLLALVVRELLQAQRRAIARLRNQGAISNDVIHRIERELDLEDTRLDIGPRRWAACA